MAKTLHESIEMTYMYGTWLHFKIDGRKVCSDSNYGHPLGSNLHILTPKMGIIQTNSQFWPFGKLNNLNRLQKNQSTVIYVKYGMTFNNSNLTKLSE